MSSSGGKIRKLRKMINQRNPGEYNRCFYLGCGLVQFPENVSSPSKLLFKSTIDHLYSRSLVGRKSPTLESEYAVTASGYVNSRLDAAPRIIREKARNQLLGLNVKDGDCSRLEEINQVLDDLINPHLITIERNDSSLSSVPVWTLFYSSPVFRGSVLERYMSLMDGHEISSLRKNYGELFVSG